MFKRETQRVLKKQLLTLLPLLNRYLLDYSFNVVSIHISYLLKLTNENESPILTLLLNIKNQPCGAIKFLHEMENFFSDLGPRRLDCT